MQPVLHVPAFEDNYIWLIRGQSDREVAIVDPGDAEPVFAAMADAGLAPAAVLCTHHHGDHTGGIEELKERFPDLPVYGPPDENIPGRTVEVHEGQAVDLPSLGLRFHVMHIPGHTRGHVAYVGHGQLYCGDTIFSAGCGRLFEGTAQQMHDSLARLAALAAKTEVYCAHEYTSANLRFAATVEPDNRSIQEYRAEVADRRSRDEPTVPTTIERELEINPFLRSHVPSVRRAAEIHFGKTLPDTVSVFAAVRRWKDNFR